jgi:hypothetical protein
VKGSPLGLIAGGGSVLALARSSTRGTSRPLFPRRRRTTDNGETVGLREAYPQGSEWAREPLSAM